MHQDIKIYGPISSRLFELCDFGLLNLPETAIQCYTLAFLEINNLLKITALKNNNSSETQPYERQIRCLLELVSIGCRDEIETF